MTATTSLFVDDGGPTSSTALPVVFVHSFGGNTTHWAAQLEHLRHTRRAIALDLRGSGKSGPPDDGDYSIEALARDVASVVDSLDLRRLVLVGHSQGATTALAYAGAHPERVAGLVLIDSPTGSCKFSTRGHDADRRVHCWRCDFSDRYGERRVSSLDCREEPGSRRAPCERFASYTARDGSRVRGEGAQGLRSQAGARSVPRTEAGDRHTAERFADQPAPDWCRDAARSHQWHGPLGRAGEAGRGQSSARSISLDDRLRSI